jgi:hypothetical protein
MAQARKGKFNGFVERDVACGAVIRSFGDPNLAIISSSLMNEENE